MCTSVTMALVMPGDQHTVMCWRSDLREGATPLKACIYESRG